MAIVSGPSGGREYLQTAILLQPNRVVTDAERRHVNALGQGAACRGLWWPVIIALRHPSGKDRLTLAREIELVQPLIAGRPPKG